MLNKMNNFTQIIEINNFLFIFLNFLGKERGNISMPNYDYKLTGERLLSCRKERELTQEYIVYDILHFGSKKHYIDCEKGESILDLESLTTLSKFYKCDLDYLLGKISTKTRKKQNIANATSLSEDAINVLLSLSKQPNTDLFGKSQNLSTQTLSEIITSPIFPRLMGAAYNYIYSIDSKITMDGEIEFTTVESIFGELLKACRTKVRQKVLEISDPTTYKELNKRYNKGDTSAFL